MTHLRANPSSPKANNTTAPDSMVRALRLPAKRPKARNQLPLAFLFLPPTSKSKAVRWLQYHRIEMHKVTTSAIRQRIRLSPLQECCPSMRHLLDATKAGPTALRIIPV